MSGEEGGQPSSKDHTDLHAIDQLIVVSFSHHSTGQAVFNPDVKILASISSKVLACVESSYFELFSARSILLNNIQDKYLPEHNPHERGFTQLNKRAT